MNTIHIHNAKTLKVASHSPDNSNAITLRVEQTHYSDEVVRFDLLIFGLPTSVTDALIAALADGGSDNPIEENITGADLARVRLAGVSRLVGALRENKEGGES